MTTKHRLLNRLLSALGALLLLAALFPTAALAANETIVANSAAAARQTLADWLAENWVFLLIIAVVVIAAGVLLFVRAQKTKQQKKLNRTLQLQHDFLRHLYDTVPCGIFQYEYEQPHRIINCNAAVQKIYGYDSDCVLIGKTPDAVVAEGTIVDFLEKFQLCEQTGGPISYVWPITRSDGTMAYTERIMDIVATEQGRVFQEVFINVTERETSARLVESRYMQELNRNEQRGDGMLYTICFDIDEQLLTQTDLALSGVQAGITVDAFFAAITPALSEFQTQEERNALRARFSAKYMANAYVQGRSEQSVQLCSKTDGALKWLRCDLALRHNPQTGHMMCFTYIRDVTDEYITEKIMRNMALSDCDGFMSIDPATDRCIQYVVEDGGKLTRHDGFYGDISYSNCFSQRFTVANPEQLHRATALCEVQKRLEAEEYYQVFATLTDDGSKRIDKALTFFYTDRKYGLLAVTVTDVTEIRAGEVRHAQLLSDALAAAEKAGAAKGQFLSRVSHEMRTPLNAIIGFIELAKGASAEEMTNYLASSAIAAKQLLNVINDVLDMSSIESGKMKVANAPFNFKRMLTSLTNIYGTQCKQKGVNFEIRMKSVTEDWLIGDELRVNQIFMNLLGNAVKFTERGYVFLTVAQTTVGADKAFFRFEISDTGCGMSEGMLGRLFRPFEQESATTAHKYGGSGLGLSIVKNLIGIMGGTIDVKSALGEGTTFRVELPFGRTKIGSGAVMADVTRLRVLAVDDDKTELDYMGRVLSRMNVRFTCVDSGKAALAALEAAEHADDPYTICLVDWRMPELNGEETTRRIRERYGRDVVVIVVSAYDYYQAGEAVKSAGADMFLSKPLFQSSLFDLFMTLTGGRIAAPIDELRAWDFAGKRVLLAEDNVLNQIVAKGYLAKINVVVELAVNGQEAVERFASSSPGYYDAILMDIQMPAMDGLEATQAIRASSHPDAKTVPIIAQTADAFNEDIARALSVGMNAHVAKPIKPDALATALAKAFDMKGKQEAKS